MTTLAVRRRQVPLWAIAAIGAIAWLIAWFINLPASEWAAYDLLRLERGSKMGDSMAFFLLDVPKVLLLLTGIVTLVSFLRSFVSPERVRTALAGRGVLPGTIAAAGFGVLTPFCSCSAVPLFIGFVEAGVPLGVTFAFLVASPMVNEVALVLLFGLFGPGVALLYLAAGLTVAIFAGLLIGRMGMGRYVEDYVWKIRATGGIAEIRPTLEDRVRDAWRSTTDIVRRVLPYVVAGIAVGRSSTALSRPTSSSRSAAATTHWPCPRLWCSAFRSTATRPGRSRSSKPCSARAYRWGRPSPS